jgi:hypothetical protein
MRPRRARSATKVTQVATPLLSVLPLVESHTLNAIQDPELARCAIQKKTQITAFRPRKLATKNVPHKFFQNVISKLESVINVTKQEEKAASQLQVVKLHAEYHHTQRTININVTGNMPPHNAFKMTLVP